MLFPHPPGYAPAKEDLVLDGLSENIVFSKNPIELTEDRKDWNQVLLKGYAQTNCHSNKTVYMCDVKIFFVLNNHGSLETINLMIFDPRKEKYLLLRMIDVDMNYKYHGQVKVIERDIAVSMIYWKNIENNMHNNKDSIEATENEHNLKGKLSIYREKLRGNGEIESTLDIRYKSQGTIKTKRIFLNAKKRR